MKNNLEILLEYYSIFYCNVLRHDWNVFNPSLYTYFSDTQIRKGVIYYCFLKPHRLKYLRHGSGRKTMRETVILKYAKAIGKTFATTNC